MLLRKNEERPQRENMRTKWLIGNIFRVRSSHPYALCLIANHPSTVFIDKFRYNAAKSSEAQSRIKKLEKLPVLEEPEDEYTVAFKFPEVEKLSPPIIQMTGKTLHKLL